MPPKGLKALGKKIRAIKRNARKGKGRRGVRRSKRSSNVPEYASLSTKYSITAPGGGTFQPNTLYNYMNAQLVGVQRAVQVAQAYQFYRIRKVALTFKPLYDTFLGAAGNMTKPNLYFMLDKSGSVPINTSLDGLKAMGARPRQLDEKNIVIKWAPSVLESAMYIAGAPGNAAPAKYQIHPWLSTNANSANPGVWVASGIDHLGIHWYLDQLISTGYAYTVEVELQFQFKGPLTTLLAATPGQAAVLAEKNDSPDGIVGGGDGV